MTNDLISRSALLEGFQFRLPIISERAEVVARCVEIARRLINKAPAVDAVEVVRCKDCKHRDTVYCAMDIDILDVADDMFCSFGERRADT